MADNIIKRIIKMVLDRESAQKTQSDANAVADSIEKSWKSMAAKIAGYLSVAFLLDKLLAFGKSAVDEAAKAEASWSKLAGTVNATGASFDSMSAQLHATASAFQDATTHSTGEFADSLGRVISLTGDASASMHNMGLIANVAAEFFGGELEPAANLVAKAMNGNTTALMKLGISANTAQEALNILATRSMGAAERETKTFTGQTKQLTNSWNDVKESIGNAIISSDGATDAFSVLRAAIKTLGEWVDNNRDVISNWVTRGIRFAIDATDVLYRATVGMTDLLKGGFQEAVGLAAQGLAKLVEGYAAAKLAIITYTGLNKDEIPEILKLFARADAIDTWAASVRAAGEDSVKKGLKVLATPIFSSDQFANAPTGAAPKLPGSGNAPEMGAHAITDSTKAVTAAIKQFNEDALAAANMQKILGDHFDATGAEIDRTTKLLNVLAANGIQPASVGFVGLSDRLQELTTHIKPLSDASKAMTKALLSDMAQGAITTGSAIEQLSRNGADALTLASADLAASVEMLKQKQSDVLTAIRALLDAGFLPTDQAVQDLTARYRDLSAELSDTTKVQMLMDAYRALGDEIRGNLFLATLDSATNLDKMKIKQQALLKAIQTLLSQGIKPEDKALRDLVKQYKDVTAVIKEQTIAMQLQAAAADFLADALGTAMAGGLHEAAAQKAKQNAIEAAEMLVRAGAFALFGDFPHASAALILAGQFAGLAAAWGVLAASTHGSGGATAPSVTSSGGGSAGSDLGSSRASSNDASSRSQQPSAEVSIYMVGPGFDALNPEVQRVVWGAQQQAQERYGPNARIRVVPRG